MYVQTVTAILFNSKLKLTDSSSLTRMRRRLSFLFLTASLVPVAVTVAPPRSERLLGFLLDPSPGVRHSSHSGLRMSTSTGLRAFYPSPGYVTRLRPRRRDRSFSTQGFPESWLSLYATTSRFTIITGWLTSCVRQGLFSVWVSGCGRSSASALRPTNEFIFSSSSRLVNKHLVLSRKPITNHALQAPRSR